MNYMASPRCMAAATAAAKGQLSERQVLEAFDRIDAYRQKLEAQGQMTGRAAKLQRFAADEAERAKIAAAMQKRNAALNVMVRQKIDEHLDGLLEAGIKPQHAMLAMLEGTMKGVRNARKSVMATAQAYEARYLGSMMAELQKASPHLAHLLTSDALDHDITVEMSELRQGGNPGSTGNKDAITAARIFSKYSELGRTDSNRLGASIGKLDGRFGAQTHDDIKMIQAGKDAWVGFVVAHLDAERTFPDGPSAEEAARSLGDMYDTIITGISNKPLTEGRVNPANLAKSLGQSRVLHFANVEAAMAYRDKFGHGNTISGMIAEMRRFARINAAMEVLGPNPENMLHSTSDRLKQKLKADPSFPDAQKRTLANDLDTQAGPLRNALDIATGLASRPVNVTMGKVFGDIRAVQAMSKYGASVISSIGDTITASAASQFRGSGFLNGLMAQWSGVMRGRPRAEQAEIAYMLGEGFDGLIGHIVNGNVAQDGIVGRLGRAQETFFKWNALTWWTDVNRAVSARMISAEMGMRLENEWAALPAPYRHVMEMNGLDDRQWSVMQKATLTGPNGKPYMTPDRIADLSDADIAPLIEPGRTADDARRDLQMTMLRYVADETSNSVIEHDARSKRTVTLGTRPGTLAGELVRLIMQAKSYPIAFSQRTIGRAVFGNRKGAGMLEVSRNIGSLTAGLMLAGYLSMVAKDTLKGYWPPRDPTDPATILAALQQGGGAGIYGDYLFSQKSRFGTDVLGTAAGPTLGDIGNLVQLGLQARDYAIGKATNDPNAKFSGSSAFTTLLGNVPYANLFYLRPALDYLFLSSLREALKPGYLRSISQQRLKDYGQTNVTGIPPTLAQTLGQ